MPFKIHFIENQTIFLSKLPHKGRLADLPGPSKNKGLSRALSKPFGKKFFRIPLNHDKTPQSFNVMLDYTAAIFMRQWLFLPGDTKRKIGENENIFTSYSLSDGRRYYHNMI